MPKNTVGNTRLTAAKLVGASSDPIKSFINDAWLEVDALPLKKAVKGKARHYLACHLAVSDNQSTKSEQVGSLKKEYSGFHSTFTNLERTVYDQGCLCLYSEYAKKGSLGSVVI